MNSRSIDIYSEENVTEMFRYKLIFPRYFLWKSKKWYNDQKHLNDLFCRMLINNRLLTTCYANLCKPVTHVHISEGIKS